MSILDRFDIFVQTPANYFRFPGFDGIADQAQQNFRDVNVDLRAVDRVARTFELFSFSIKTLQALVELWLEGGGSDGAGTRNPYDQHCE